MARLNLNEINSRLDQKPTGDFKYINNFFLSRNKESTYIRPLLANIKDIISYSVHNVRMTSKSGKSYFIQVSCHGDNCPLCKDAQQYQNPLTAPVSKVKDNVYIPLIRLYNSNQEFDPSYEIFSRSTRWYRDEFAPFCARYDLDGVLEIQRLGTGKDTTYKLYEARKDFDGNPIKNDKTIEEYMEDFDVKSDDIFGRRDSLIQDWTTDEFEEYLETKTYPKRTNTQENEAETPRRRSSHGF